MTHDPLVTAQKMVFLVLQLFLVTAFYSLYGTFLDTHFDWERGQVESFVSKTLKYSYHFKSDWKKSSEVLRYIKFCDYLVPDEKEDFALYNAKLKLGHETNGKACVTWFKFSR